MVWGELDTWDEICLVGWLDEERVGLSSEESVVGFFGIGGFDVRGDMLLLGEDGIEVSPLVVVGVPAITPPGEVATGRLGGGSKVGRRVTDDRLADGGGGGGATLGWVGGEVPGLDTFTQSGSSDARKGFDSRFVFGTCRATGGPALALTPAPPSSHHFRPSELAGGRPGSIASYPMRSSSSVSSTSLVLKRPTSSRRRA